MKAQRLPARKATEQVSPDRRPGTQSVERALSILDLFIGKSEPLSLSKLAFDSNMVKPTVLRCLTSLERAGYIIRLPTARYQLAAKVAQLGATYRDNFSLETHVLPTLRSLTAETLESTSFHVREGEKRLCLFRLQSPQAVRDYTPDVLQPMDRSSIGMVLVGFGKRETSAASPVRLIFGSSGIGNAQTSSISTAVYGPDANVIGAMVVSGPSDRFRHNDMKRLSHSLGQAADKLSLVLGSPRDLAFRPLKLVTEKHAKDAKRRRASS